MEMKRRFGLIKIGIICLFCLSLVFSALYAELNTYAESAGIPFVIDKIPIESVTICADSETTKLERGQSVWLSVEVSPYNANKTLVQTSYEITKGNKYAFIKNEDTLEVSASAPIGERIEVIAVVDGVESENVLTFEIIETPVQYIEITNEETEIIFGSSFRLETEIFPENATNQAIIYSVTSGSEYVRIGYGGVVRFKKDVIPEDDLTVTFGAKSVGNPSAVAEKSFVIKKSVFETINATFELREVETMRTYSFDTEPYKDYFDEKDVEYSIDAEDDIATIDLGGLLYIKPTAAVGQIITVTIKSSDGEKTYTQELEVVAVYPDSFEPIIVTEPSIVYENVAYYFAGDEIEFEVEVFEPINTSEKAFTLKVSDDTLATVDGNKVKIADNITAENPSFSVVVYSPDYEHKKLESAPFIIKIYVPATAIVCEKNTDCINNLKSNQNATELEEGHSYDMSELMDVAVLPSNNSACNQKYKLCDDSLTYASIAEGNNGNDELIIKENLPAGEVKVGVYVETKTYNADGTYVTITSEPLYFDVYKPTRFIELALLTENPYSAKATSSTVEINVAVSDTASINMPSFEIVQGDEFIDGDIAYENSVVSFKLKKSNEFGAYKPIKITAMQDGVQSEILIYFVIPDEDLELLPDSVDRGSSYSFEVTHTSNATNNEIEWRISDESGLMGVSKVTTAPNTFYVPINLCADTEITIEYRSAEKVFFGDNAPWKTAVYTVKKLNANTENIKLVYNDSPTLSVGFNVVYDKDSSSIDIDRENPQLMVGRSTTVTLKYGANGAPLTYYGMKIKGVNVVGSATGCVGTDNNTFSITIKGDAIGNTDVEISVVVSDGNKEYTVDCGKLQVFRQLSKDGTLGFRKMTANNTDIRNLVDWENSVNKSASYGIDKFTFKIGSNSSGASIDNNIVTVNSYTASKEQYIKYSCTEYYNGEKISTYEGTGYLPLDYVDVDNNGGSGALSHLIRLDGFRYDLNKDQLPTRSGYTFAGYVVYNSYGAGLYCFDEDGKKNNLNFGGGQTLYASWDPWKVTVTRYRLFDDDDKYEQGKVTLYYGTKKEFKESSTYVSEEKCTFDGWYLYSEKQNGEKIEVLVNERVSTDYSSYIFEDKHIKYDGQEFVLTAKWITPSSCVASGTLITLADGSMVPVEDLKGDEQLLVWNFETGDFDVAPIVFIANHGIREYLVTKLTFSDGTYVDMITEHGFWDVMENRYVYLTADNAFDYIGHRFNKSYYDDAGVLRYKDVELISVVNTVEMTNAYSPVTYKHLSCYVNGLLSVPAKTQSSVNYFEVNAEQMKYDQEKMEKDIEEYGLFDYERDFSDLIPEIIFDALNGKYLKIAIGKGLITWEVLVTLIGQYSYILVGGAA